MANVFIGKETLEEIANKYSEEVMLSGVYFRAETLERLKIKVSTGVEYQDTINVMSKKGHGAKRKVVGDKLESQLGFIEERKLQAETVWVVYKDNKDNYVTNKLVNTLGTNDSMAYPAMELAFKAMIPQFGEDLYECMWHGDRTIDRNGANYWLGLYDGFITYLNKDINKGRISKDLKNYVELNAIAAPVDKDDYSAWTEFKKFVSSWSPILRNQPLVLVYCTPESRENISTAYTNFHHSYKEPNYTPAGTTFNEYPGIILVDDASFGRGDKLIATVPENFEIGVDTLTSKQAVGVIEGYDGDVFNVHFQMQTIMGTRVNNVNPSSFCMSNGNLEHVSLSGDYLHNSITVSSANVAEGTVAKSDAKTEYAVGDTVTLTATPAEGFVFDTWLDGVTTAVRTVVGIGQPQHFIAKFKAA